MNETHIVKTITELSTTQLYEIASMHLRAPLEWGERDHDNESARSELVTKWESEHDRENNEILAILAQSDEKVVAFVWVELIEERQRFVHIKSIWVEPNHRRQGLAKYLKKRVESWAMERNADRVESYVHSLNKSMLQLNYALGYKDTYIKQVKFLDKK